MIGHQTATWLSGIAGILAGIGILTLGNSFAKPPSMAVPAEENVVKAPQTDLSSDTLEELVAKAFQLQADVIVQDAAIQRLRELGPAAVDYLMSRQDIRLSPRWNDVLDIVAQQKDAKYTGFYWYTDLDRAVAAAKREKKPVLSLRLLGNLTDELSCANSRFFRTTLYPDPSVRELLASKFVLHWQSVRPVPVITIDFRDGRKIEQTITGNSLHLVLDEEGRPVDVLPGLYAPGTFIDVLKQAGPVAIKLAELGENEFLAERAKFHSERLTALQQSWSGYCQQFNLRGSLSIGVDQPVEVWNQIAKLAVREPIHAKETRRAVAEHALAAPPAEAAGKFAAGKGMVETPIMRLIRNVSLLIKEDSVRNEYYLHVQIHKWFVTSAEAVTATIAGNSFGRAAGGRPGGGFGGGQFGGTPSVPSMILVKRHLEREPLVSRIYSELFLSPLDDPWYGLSQPDVYSAIKNNGRIDAVTQNTGH